MQLATSCTALSAYADQAGVATLRYATQNGGLHSLAAPLISSRHPLVLHCTARNGVPYPFACQPSSGWAVVQCGDVPTSPGTPDSGPGQRRICIAACSAPIGADAPARARATSARAAELGFVAGHVPLVPIGTLRRLPA